jgi:hypothetical protein
MAKKLIKDISLEVGNGFVLFLVFQKNTGAVYLTSFINSDTADIPLEKTLDEFMSIVDYMIPILNNSLLINYILRIVILEQYDNVDVKVYDISFYHKDLSKVIVDVLYVIDSLGCIDELIDFKNGVINEKYRMKYINLVNLFNQFIKKTFFDENFELTYDNIKKIIINKPEAATK